VQSSEGMMQRVRDVMTQEVFTVGPSTPFKEIVELLRTHRIDAAPVIDDRRHVLGVVSEADLLLKVEHPRDHEPRWARLRHYEEHARARGTIARDFMSSPAATIHQSAPVREAVELLHARHIKRLPVVDTTGRLVGIVSRGDLLKVFLRPDGEIQLEIRDLIGVRLPGEAGRFNVNVDRGIVTLDGRCHLRSSIAVLSRLCYAVDGVVHVDQRLEFDVDDRHAQPSTSHPLDLTHESRATRSRDDRHHHPGA
jgi:CBS domain-containing protein